MEDLIRHALDVPVANLCALAGLVFLAIGVIGNISGRIQPGNSGRIAAGVVGSLLLIYGIVSHSESDLHAQKTDSNSSQPRAET